MPPSTKTTLTNASLLLTIVLAVLSIMGVGYVVAAYPYRLGALENHTVPALRAEVESLRTSQTANRELLLRIDERIQQVQRDVGDLKRRGP